MQYNRSQKAIIKLIEWYQRVLSPDTGFFRRFFPGGYCKFTPSCSEYFKQSVIKNGAFRGSILGIWRIMRCNPWSKGGYDPVK